MKVNRYVAGSNTYTEENGGEYKPYDLYDNENNYDTEKSYAENNSLQRDLEDIKNDDIIYRKCIIKEVLEQDPDLLMCLGVPQNKVKTANMTDDEQTEIDDYNSKIKNPEVIPWLKINEVVKNVQNVVLLDIKTDRASYDNPAFRRDLLICMVLIDESSMDTEFDVPRADLVAYIIKDLLNRSNIAGMDMKLVLDEPRIIDNNYYCRELNFEFHQPNFASKYNGTGNKYDRYQ